MKAIAVIAIILKIQFGNAQNLVPNGEFEIYSACPNNAGQISFAIGWVNAAQITSPDYCNACGPVGANVPYGSVGYQRDYASGGAFAGIYTYAKQFPNDGREYIQIKLLDTLKVGKKYLATMHVSLSNAAKYSISSLGMNFSNNAIASPVGVGFINIPNPQVNNSNSLNDTLNWMLVQDTLIALGNEQYLTIGNFSVDSTSDTLTVNPSSNWEASYYYIDGVSVVEIPTVGLAEKQLEFQSVKVFPNPASTELSIDLNAGEFEICLSDIFGKQIRLENAREKTRWDVSTMREGIYFLQFRNLKSNYTFAKKILIQR